MVAAARAVLLLGIALLSAFAVEKGTRPENDLALWAVIGVTGAALLMLVGDFIYGKWEGRRARPKIVVHDAPHPMGMHLGRVTYSGTPGLMHGQQFRVGFSNEARSGKESAIASDVTATIEVPGGNVPRAHGRWREFDWREREISDPLAVFDDLPPVPVTMFPDGAIRWLDVLVCADWRADDASPEEWKWEGVRLLREPLQRVLLGSAVSPGEQTLTITLRGRTLAPVVFKYRLSVPKSDDASLDSLFIEPELIR